MLFERESFSSAPDNLIVVRFTADRPHQLHATLSLDGELASSVTAPGNNRLLLTGKAAAHSAGAGHPDSEKPVVLSDEPGNGMYFATLLEIRVEAGTTTTQKAADGRPALAILNATSFTALVSAATGYRGFTSVPDLAIEQIATICASPLDRAARTSFATLRERHIADHQRLFRRASLRLGPNATSRTEVPTDRRVRNYDQSDVALLSLYFAYSRYLLIASSRPGSQPANLQGIWNAQVTPPWSSNWTTNINTQMNYWHAETCNLGECASPLIDLITDLSTTGAVAAREPTACRAGAPTTTSICGERPTS